GEVIAARHASGRKVAAFRTDAGEVNEQHLTVIRRPGRDLDERAVAAATGHLGWAAAAGIAGLGLLAFFRDPARRFDGEPDVVLAPAAGLVTLVDLVEDPAPELEPGSYHRVVTFLSVFDVHVQKTPAGGEVIASRHASGRKVAAFRTDAGEVNEQHLTVIRRPGGELIGVRQIAGLLARRVVCYLAAGERVERGEPLGLIKFGSRVDLLVPASYRLLVKKGDRVRNGATPVAAPVAMTVAPPPAGPIAGVGAPAAGPIAAAGVPAAGPR
ncbi:MAG TPA: phosphatidylserine decarboxylase, partial [Thermoanaerobaculia bacterium]|nr:phosphatidylserine decarboxylase [Thermoanaerobaculia bacterium]